MNTFVLHLAQEFSAVAYYTVTLDGGDRNEFAQFWDKRTTGKVEALTRDFDRLTSQLEFMGESIAPKDHFRPESEFGGTACALPQKGNRLWDSGWRLYCMHITDFCIILFNGGVKTADRPKHCPSVGRHFYNANAISIAIGQALREGRITVKNDRLIWDPEEVFTYKPLP